MKKFEVSDLVKIILVISIVVISVVVIWKQNTIERAEEAYIAFTDESFVTVDVQTSKRGHSDTYILEDKAHIDTLMKSLKEIERNYSTLEQFRLDEDIVYYLKFHKSSDLIVDSLQLDRLSIYGGNMMDLKVYDYARNEYLTYRFEVQWDIDELSDLLIK